MAVPRLAAEPIATAPVSGVRVPTNVPSAAIGVPDTGIDFRPAIDAVSAIAEHQRRLSFNTALLASDNQLAQLGADLRAKARGYQGQNALGAIHDVQDEWTKGVAEIAKSIKTTDQQEAFAQRVASRWDSLYAAVETHAATEHQRYVDDTYSSAVANRIEHAADAYQHPDVVMQQVGEARAIVADYGRSQGWSSEMLAAKTSEAVTQIHAGVIERMLATDKDLDAANYLTQHRDEMSGARLTHVEQQVESGSVLGTSQRAADRITKSARNESAAFDDATRLTDPRVRERTQALLREAYSEQARAKRDRALQLESDILIGYRHGKTPTVAMLDELTRLDPGAESRINVQRQAMTRVFTDRGILHQLRNLQATKPEEFARTDLTRFADKLSDADYSALQRSQIGILSTDRRHAQTTIDHERVRLNKELSPLKRQAEMYQANKLPVPVPILRHIRQLQDSIRAINASKPGTAAAPGDDDQNADDVNAVKSGTVSVPSAWLEHAKRDPAYAEYLRSLGVSIP